MRLRDRDRYRLREENSGSGDCVREGTKNDIMGYKSGKKKHKSKGIRKEGLKTSIVPNIYASQVSVAAEIES